MDRPHLHEDEDVHGVIVLAERPGDEAVVVRVHDGGVEDPVHLDEPRLLVQLVLDLAPLGDLHDLVTEERSRISLQCGWLQVATTLAGCGEMGSIRPRVESGIYFFHY